MGTWNLLKYDAFAKFTQKDFNLAFKHESNNMNGKKTKPELGTVFAFLNLTKNTDHKFSFAW